MNTETDLNEEEFTGACNSLPLGAGSQKWLCLAEYGDWPHARGLQRFTRESAERMCGYFRSLRGRLARRFGGLPIYVGHPDDPGFTGQSGHGDTRAYAWISDMEAREDGLYALPRWSEEGQRLLANAHYKFLSPRWAMKDLGQGVFEPIRLLSVGLTNQPNIPGLAIANEVHNKAPVELPLTLENLLQVLKLEDSEDPILACEALREECEFLRQNNEELARENEHFYRIASDSDAAREKAENSLANERLHRVNLLLDQAEAQGRILPNERDQHQTAMLADLPAGIQELCEAKPVLKTTCLTQSLGKRKSGAGHREAFLSVVNERVSSTGETFAVAWNNTKQSRPELFEQLSR